MINFEFNSVIELVNAFPTEDICIKHLERIRWNGLVISPFDSSSKVYKCAGGKYRCKNTGKYFNVRTGTMFDNTKIPLQKWFMGIYLITNHKKGISSMQLHRDLNITQKSSWFMLQRIRNCFNLFDRDDNGKIGGGGQAVEVDETYVGGKVPNMTKVKRKKHAKGEINSQTNKMVVMGYAVRGGELQLKSIVGRVEIISSVLETVATDAVLITDTSGFYKGIGNKFAGHETVDHSKDEFVRGSINTNTIEGAFSMFDRMVMGTYHFISSKHIQKYLDELCFRYNTRNTSGNERFNLLLANAENRTTYKMLIAK